MTDTEGLGEVASTDAFTPVFRAANQQLVQSVTVVTTVDGDGAPHGITVGAFLPLSKRPPLVLVAIDHRSGLAELVRASRCFAVNLLAEGNDALATRFATRGIDKFDGVGFETRTTGAPVLTAQAISFHDCWLAGEQVFGDHVVFVGAPVCSGVLEPDTAPLVYRQRGYCRVEG